MVGTTRHHLLAGTLLALHSLYGSPAAGQEKSGEIQLIVRSDDMGAAHAVNEACLLTVTEGVARSIEVLVPSPWFPEAVEMLNKHPDIDVGIHLDLTSEWSRVKWGPVSKNVPSLVDENGHFFPMTRQRAGWPPNSGFLECGWSPDEVETELRAQIEMAVRLLPKVTHLSAHMGTATSAPALREIVDRLSTEFQLPLLRGLSRVEGLGGKDASPEEKEANFIASLEALEPGVWLFVEHPGLDTAEMRAISHRGYENVAADRSGVTYVMTSDRVKAVIAERGIKLVSYADVIESRRSASERR